MRHGISGNRLGRNQTLRKATVRDIAKATLLHQRITTTKAKAKEARKLVDKLITLGKHGSLAAKRRAFSILTDHHLVSRLFNRTSPLFKSRNGGYTRIILLGNRRGDNAQLAFLELTEKEDIIISQPKSTASAKKEKVKAPAKIDAKASPAQEVKVDKKQAEKKDDSKKVQPKDLKKEPNIKDSKFSGIRKMFQRKTD